MPPNYRPPTPLAKHSAGALHRTPGPEGAGATHPLAPDAVELELQELSLDMIHLAFDLAGLVDPTPISDGASALLALGRGQWLDAVISGASMIPYVGDLAKAGKLPKYLKSVERAIELADKSKKAARELLPGLEKLDRLLELIPAGANAKIDAMRARVRAFLAKNARASTMAKVLPDISKTFNFRKYESNGKIYHEASGRLGIPGKVKTHRSKSSQSSVSSGTGDDAGHLIGDRFGAPGGTENLTLQNYKTNRGGTFKQLEDSWADKLEGGWGIEVKVLDVTKKGEDRPFMRSVQWVEIAPNGERKVQNLDFVNTHTPKSRAQQGIAPTVDTPQKDNVIHVDFTNKTKQ